MATVQVYPSPQFEAPTGDIPLLEAQALFSRLLASMSVQERQSAQVRNMDRLRVNVELAPDLRAGMRELRKRLDDAAATGLTPEAASELALYAHSIQLPKG